ncbi:FecR domain-containing protein [Sphingomonas quercus]|uniref:FecR domain-containing protein n=1 Tax=Sphingomonas quercus TaxID=2842451 RepID=A0ABS6BJQ0_9SPHN|nr:FecR domain-containing protein [Sphingomonas quercus]MBU3078072.1 FecR domain-containing protein [Sphingomonas quercus]
MTTRAASEVLEAASLWCIRLADGDMSEDEHAQLDAWLARDPEHRRAFDNTIRTWRELDSVRLEPDLLAHRSAALKDLASANRRRWAARLFVGRPFMTLAASLLLLLAGYAGYAGYGYFAFTIYATGTGERRLVMLPDGSRISLDADTSIGVRYRGDRRELRLAKGRAKFDVAKDSLRPFTVTAGDRIVVATGTEFSVELLSRNLHVILYEGAVNVVPVALPGDDKTGKRRGETRLAPGKELVARAASEAELAPGDLNSTLSWEAGFLTFEDEPLYAAVERMNRYSQQKFAVGDDVAGRLLVNGVYSSNDTDAFVAGVVGVLPVHVEDRDGVRTFLRNS